MTSQRVIDALRRWPRPTRYIILLKDDRGQCYWSDVVEILGRGTGYMFEGSPIRTRGEVDFETVSLFDELGQLVEEQPVLVGCGHNGYLRVQYFLEVIGD